ncbi:platelet glycoprotein VI-like isoform X1 [Numida meleagris]|uniref:platelet glycoprotein VI-like isoform X1 n=1 Tax=Numida meleagris TaxID=8996 RepID=UPI000B3DCD74|nr:platelet glycoprotein VI-like isoform X1 [Numida meleagris]
MGTESSSPATPCPHCSLAVPKLLLPHGTNGTGPHPGTRTVSLAGWCLAAASRAQQLPRPSLSLHPSQGVSMGDTVTLQCHLPRLAARVELYQGGRWRSVMDKKEDMAEFSLVSTEQEDAGTYRCKYRVLEPPWTSRLSEPVELVITGEVTGENKCTRAVSSGPCPIAPHSLDTDRMFPPPGISLHPEKPVRMGTNVTIHCWNNYNGITFLHKDGCSAPIQHQDPDGGGTATFTLFGVTPADAGSYRCFYRPKGFYPFLSSPLGNNVTLEMESASAPPGAEGTSYRNFVVAVVRGCAAALVFALGLYFILDARSLWIQRDVRSGDPQ